jgi:hypothetical protein
VPPVSRSARSRSRAESQAGRERPPLGCPLLRPRPRPQGVAHAPDACRCRPAEPRDARDIAECAAGIVRDPRIDFIGRNTRCQVFAGNSVHIGERALAPNQRLRRSPTVTSSQSSNPRVRFVSWVLALRTWWPHAAAITPTDCPAVLGPVKPLRFAPSLTGCGLDRACGSAGCLAIA